MREMSRVASTRAFSLVAGILATTCSFWIEAAELPSALSNVVERARAIVQKGDAPNVPGFQLRLPLMGKLSGRKDSASAMSVRKSV